MKRFRTKAIYNDSKLALIAVESLECRYDESATGCWLLGNMKPVAVIVCDTGGTRVLGIEEGLDDIDLLIEDVPELEPMIASLTKN